MICEINLHIDLAKKEVSKYYLQDSITQGSYKNINSTIKKNIYFHKCEILYDEEYRLKYFFNSNYTSKRNV